jgi:hypothetical protein
MTKINKPVIAVWFSCGAASAVAAKKTIELYGDTHVIRIINNPVLEEDEDNRRFLKDVEAWIGGGYKIELAINPKFPNNSAVEIWEKRKFMSGPRGAPCTLELKKEARYFWENNNHADFHVLGFTVDEWQRAKNFKNNERSNVLPVLVNELITKKDCFKIIQEAGIKLPRIYALGYPNANCIGCVKASSPEYWNHVRKVHPEVFKERADQSRRIGARLVRVNNKRIFLDELSPEAKGRSMKNMNSECGIFCEEKL